MKTYSIGQDKKDRAEQNEAPGISSLLSQYMQTQFQSHLSQFDNATISPKSPLHALLNTSFITAAQGAELAANPANLHTGPLHPTLASYREDAGTSMGAPAAAALEQDASESVASLQSQGRLSTPSPETPGKFQDIVQEASQKYGVPVALINAVIRQESAFNPSARSHAGAEGLMQLMPATAKAYGCNNSADPRQNVMAGTHFLSDLLKQYKGDVELALAGYNAGPGNVAKYGNQVPPFRETQNYVVKVQQYYQSNIAAAERGSARFAKNDPETALQPARLPLKQT